MDSDGVLGNLIKFFVENISPPIYTEIYHSPFFCIMVYDWGFRGLEIKDYARFVNFVGKIAKFF